MVANKRYAPFLIVVTTLAGIGAVWNELSHRPRTVEVSVTGMSCEGCAATIRDRLANLPGASNVEVSAETGKASVLINGWSGIDEADVAAAIKDAGYQVAE